MCPIMAGFVSDVYFQSGCHQSSHRGIRLRKSNNFCLFILFTLIFLSGCGGSSSWSEALDQAAPADPHKSIRSEGSEEQASGIDSTSEPGEREEESREVTRPQPETDMDSEVVQPSIGTSVINLVLQDFPDCYYGVIRLYVDGRYVDQFDTEGKLRVIIEPGEKLIDVWDSRGRWQVNVTAGPGEEKEVTIICEDRKSLGDS